jgi:ankyrin repeat protein
VRRSAALAALACAGFALAPSTRAEDAALARLIQSGERARALASVRAGADVNEAQPDGTTPLHWAVYRVDRELAAELVARGAKVDAVNRFGARPFVEAVKAADVELVELLLEAGADVESANEDGQTALMLATRTGSLPVAELLVAHGADVDAVESWRLQTPLMWAADSGAAEIVSFLIEQGADVEARGDANDWGAQITSEPRAQYRPVGGFTPLLYAARSGCTACAAALLDAGADIERPNPEGMTPLILTIDNHHFGTAELLLERGANPQVWDWYHRTPLYVAVDASGSGARPSRTADGRVLTALDVARRLLEAGVDPNAQLNMHRPSRGGNIGRFVDDLLTTGATPLLRAAVFHDTMSVELLLAHDALVDLPNVMGVTPLMAAAGMGISSRDRLPNLEREPEQSAIATLELLLAAGADVNKRVTDITSRTARIARPSTMSEREGQTALYGAIKFAWPRVVAFLIERGAEVDVVDALGKSPVDAALGNVGGRDNEVSEEIAAMLRRAVIMRLGGGE